MNFKWKNIRLGIKFTNSFGFLLMLLIIVGVRSFIGIDRIIDDASEIIDGNKFRANVEHKYVQHLQWIEQLNELVYNNKINKIDIQTDPKKCAFGQWYYGGGLDSIKEIAPELMPIFEQMEQPFLDMYESAQKILDVYHPADYQLSIEMESLKADHLSWSNSIKDALLNKQRRLNVQMDPQKSKLIAWVNKDLTKQVLNEDPILEKHVEEIIVEHKKLHQSAKKIDNYLRRGDFADALVYYQNNTEVYLTSNLKKIDNLIAYNNKNLEGLIKAEEILKHETLEHLNVLANLFDGIFEDSKKYLMTDDAMISSARRTSASVLIFIFIALIFGIITTVLLTRSLVGPLKKAIIFAQKISEGDLTAKINLDQKDEVGQMVHSLGNMSKKLTSIVEDITNGANSIAQASLEMNNTSQDLSQSASEQASSVEEVSSSMEEMASNIQQNAENAEKTESIAKSAQEGIRKGYESADISSSSMKKIAEKISIINEIAFQTNILALNAAVEAARAGEFGKGFAVVASEVRKLAERSKEAAEEIDKVSKDGVGIVEEASKQLAEIVPEIEKTSILIQEIAAASLEQNSGANQINKSIQQLNNMTQRNAAAAEEMATNAEELSAQANLLKELIAYFKIDGSKFEKKSIINSSQLAGKPVLQTDIVEKELNF
jgi:methyl-accepting chemotaxis protein